MPNSEDAELEARYRHWINHEIPVWLDKFSSFDAFDKAMPAACASPMWKVVAYGMAKERWNVERIVRIYP
ncbi:hypothetical protein LC612_39360 [Nostoc sp. CHAB 5834]|nr:hypothetical protein [Nostoc sp. CHAB 5834]